MTASNKNGSAESVSTWLQKYLWPFFSNKLRLSLLGEGMRSSIFKARIVSIFFSTYRLGFEGKLASDTFEKVILTNLNQGENKKNLRFFLLSFFALPNQLFFEKEKLTALKIFHSFIGWHRENAPVEQKLINTFILVPLFKALWNLAKMVCGTAWNILKLFTEFLPRCAEQFFAFGASWCVDKMNKENFGEAFFCGVGAFFSILLYYFFKAWRLFGRAITSPGVSVRAALQVSQELQGYKGKIAAVSLVTLSLSITIAAYIIIFPLAVKAIMVNAPAAISWLSSALEKSKVVHRIGDGLLKIFKPLVDAFRKVLTFMGAKTGPNSEVGKAFSTSAAATTSAIYTFVVLPLHHLIKKFSNWWQGRNQEKPLETKGSSSGKPASRYITSGGITLSSSSSSNSVVAGAGPMASYVGGTSVISSSRDSLLDLPAVEETDDGKYSSDTHDNNKNFYDASSSQTSSNLSSLQRGSFEADLSTNGPVITLPSHKSSISSNRQTFINSHSLTGPASDVATTTKQSEHQPQELQS